jgi:hypothetical protein
MTGCAGQAHISVPPKLLWPPGGSGDYQQSPEPDPTRPANLPDRGY